MLLLVYGGLVMRVLKLLVGRVGRMVSVLLWISLFFMGRVFFVVLFVVICGEVLGFYVVYVFILGVFYL